MNPINVDRNLSDQQIIDRNTTGAPLNPLVNPDGMAENNLNEPSELIQGARSKHGRTTSTESSRPKTPPNGGNDQQAQITPVRARISKRKLSPIATTPTGRQRKLSTSMYSSPKLRGMLETMADMNINDERQHDQNMAPDLIHGIGLLQRREPNMPGPSKEPRQRLYTVSGDPTPTQIVRRRLRARSARTPTLAEQTN